MKDGSPNPKVIACMDTCEPGGILKRVATSGLFATLFGALALLSQ
jgi:hypothetical protein